MRVRIFHGRSSYRRSAGPIPDPASATPGDEALMKAYWLIILCAALAGCRGQGEAGPAGVTNAASRDPVARMEERREKLQARWSELLKKATDERAAARAAA